ncbi:transcriptional pleiotropic repressor [Caldicoprobacter guelmensis]|uniref:GTP-sensing pleiotropic transcriptional regulator CodY n=1 Tax=Caldicoprobacter guelmensis TaxID=1170224 RepID=UPI001957E6F6|nr:GTP-sensing pleiotropic transcriptional regulator CodY [Caldicoprobacter guelmensis]MBM7581253.1 transcriptional pleiotropic repressor [Caldicoprobacter guelmensis]
MLESLLERIRRFNQIFQSNEASGIDLAYLCEILSQLIDSRVLLLDEGGRVIACAPANEAENAAQRNNASLMKIRSTVANVVEDTQEGKQKTTIVPIYCRGKRLGTLIFQRPDLREFVPDDLVLAEYSATVVGLEIMRLKMEHMAEEVRKRSTAEMAMETLSYSEREAVEQVFKELNGTEGLLVASRIADRAGITRSVIVNALRKLESAGIIESRSLGMKGTYIKVLNDKFLSQLNKT